MWLQQAIEQDGRSLDGFSPMHCRCKTLLLLWVLKQFERTLLYDNLSHRLAAHGANQAIHNRPKRFHDPPLIALRTMKLDGL